MFRFSIRELMLITAVVAMAVGWATDHWRPSNRLLKPELKSVVMEQALGKLGYDLHEGWWTAEVRRKTDPKIQVVKGYAEPTTSPWAKP